MSISIIHTENSDKRPCLSRSSRYAGFFCFFYVVVVLSLTPVSVSAQPAGWVVNTLGETLSRFDPESGEVAQNAIVLGSDVQSAPNQVMTVGDRAVAVISNTSELQVVNLSTEETEGFIDLPVGSNPYWLELYDGATGWVSLLANNSVIKVDIGQLQAGSEITVGKSPEGLAIFDHKLYVANTGFDYGTFLYDPGSVTVIDLAADSVLYTIPVGMNPQFMAVDGAGRIHVVCTGDFFSVFGVVYLIDGSTDTLLDSVQLGGSPGQITISPEDIAFCAAGGWSDSGYVYSYRAGTGEVLHDSNNPIEIGLGCIGVTAYQDGSIYASCFNDLVYVLDGAGNRQDAFVAGSGPVHVDFSYLAGNVDGDAAGVRDLTDILYLAAAVFLGGEPIPYPQWRANVNGDFVLDLSDVLRLAAFLYLSGDPLLPSMRWPWPQ